MEPWSFASLLPAAWLAALGLLLLLACRRWLDPIPWRVAAVWAMPIAVLLWPALVGGDVLLPLGHLRHYAPYTRLPAPDLPSNDLQGDLVTEIQPWQIQVRRALRAGRWPLWNAHAGAGMGLLGDPQSQALQPLALATLGVPDAAAPGLLAALRMLAALSGMFLLLRRQGLGEAAALLGSVAHGAGAPLLTWLGWPLANAIALLPWPLYAVTRCDQAGGRRDWLLLAVSLAALLLAGHPEMILYTSGLVGLFLAAAVWRRRRSAPALRAFLARAAAAAALAAALAAPALLPARPVLAQSDRAAVLRAVHAPRPWGETWRSAWRGVSEPEALASWRRRLGLRASGLVSARSRGDFGSYWGEGNFVTGSASFNAAPVVLLGCLGLLGARRRLGGERVMVAVLAATLLAAAQPDGLEPLGARLSLLGAGFLEKVPRMMLLACFALAYLAACEAERWRRGERRAGAALAGAAALGAAIAAAYLATPRDGRPWLLYWTEARALAVELAALAAAATLLLLAARSRAGARTRALAVAGCALVLAAELAFFLRDGLRAAPAGLHYPEVPTIAVLRGRLGSDRLVGSGEALKPNFAQAHGLADLRIHGPSRPAAYDRLLLPLRDPEGRVGGFHVLGRFRHPLHDLLGARFVVAKPGTRLELPLVLKRRTGWIYERPDALPRIFLPRRVVSALPGEVAGAVAAADRGFLHQTFLVAEPARRAPPWSARRRTSRLTGLDLPESERVVARARLAEPRFLASSVYQDGGWRVLADARPREPRLANGPFVAAWLPAGARRVDLLYRPAGFLAACALAALALGAVACAALPPPGRAG